MSADEGRIVKLEVAILALKMAVTKVIESAESVIAQPLSIMTEPTPAHQGYQHSHALFFNESLAQDFRGLLKQAQALLEQVEEGP